MGDRPFPRDVERPALEVRCSDKSRRSGPPSLPVIRESALVYQESTLSTRDEWGGNGARYLPAPAPAPAMKLLDREDRLAGGFEGKKENELMEDKGVSNWDSSSSSFADRDEDDNDAL